MYRGNYTTRCKCVALEYSWAREVVNNNAMMRTMMISIDICVGEESEIFLALPPPTGALAHSVRHKGEGPLQDLNIGKADRIGFVGTVPGRDCTG